MFKSFKNQVRQRKTSQQKRRNVRPTLKLHTIQYILKLIHLGPFKRRLHIRWFLSFSTTGWVCIVMHKPDVRIVRLCDVRIERGVSEGIFDGGFYVCNAGRIS